MEAGSQALATSYANSTPSQLHRSTDHALLQTALLPAFRAVGGMVRGVGAMLDGFGSYVQGNLAPMEKLMPAVNRLAFGEHTPSYPSSCFVAPNASVIGQVIMGHGSSIWYGATVRADVNHVTIGEMTNIQDRAVVHVARNNPKGSVLPTTIGSKVCMLCRCV